MSKAYSLDQCIEDAREGSAVFERIKEKFPDAEVVVTSNGRRFVVSDEAGDERIHPVALPGGVFFHLCDGVEDKRVSGVSAVFPREMNLIHAVDALVMFRSVNPEGFEQLRQIIKQASLPAGKTEEVFEREK